MAAAAAARRAMLRHLHPAHNASMLKLRSAHTVSSGGSSFVTHEELKVVKQELLSVIKENHYQLSSSAKDLSHKFEMLDSTIKGLQDKVDASIKFNKTALDNINSKNTLYVLGLVTAFSFGVFSVARLYQLTNELFPEGLLPTIAVPKEEVTPKEP